MKSVLVIYYTQTGQLRQILDSIVSPLEADPGIRVDFLEIRPRTPFPFPWTRKAFFGIFPECVREVPIPIEPVTLPEGAHYDLILLAFQPWYLSPSLPISSFLGSPEAQKLLKDATVLPVIGARNMWFAAQASVQRRLDALGARPCGLIALIDRAPNLVSTVTIVYWLFTGRKDRFLGLFPRPGVSDADIAGAARFGEAIAGALCENTLEGLDAVLRGLGAATAADSLDGVEKRAKKIFTLWAKLIIKAPKLRPLLITLFSAELILALIVISPVNSLISACMQLARKKSGTPS